MADRSPRLRCRSAEWRESLACARTPPQPEALRRVAELVSSCVAWYFGSCVAWSLGNEAARSLSDETCATVRCAFARDPATHPPSYPATQLLETPGDHQGSGTTCRFTAPDDARWITMEF